MEYNLFLSSLTELSAVFFKLIIFATSDYNYKAINIVFCLLAGPGPDTTASQAAAPALFQLLYPWQEHLCLDGDCSLVCDTIN